MKPTLLIETSTERGLLALMAGKKILHQGTLPLGYQNSKYLLPALEKGLRELGLQIADLAYIAVGIGPGSYTGIRVGVAAAKALAFTCNLPLIGLCTLQTFIPEKAGAFAVLIDAKIGGAYGIKGHQEAGIGCYDSEPEVIPLEKLEEWLQGIETIVTPQAEPLRTKIEALHMRSLKWEECGPNPNQMAHLAEVLWKEKKGVRDGELKLLYLRKTQAEIEREQK